MSKPFQNVHQQLFILNKRGLVIEDYSKVKQYLISNNYYNIINGYSKYFFETPNKYKDGTTFDEVTYAYLFDKEIKFALLKSIFEAEKHFTSIFAYTFSEKNSKNDDFYLNVKSYHTTKKNQHQLPYIINKMNKIISKHIKKKSVTPINHYMKSHGYVPFWVIINYLTFGEVTTLFRLAPLDIQNKVSKRFYSFISQYGPVKTRLTPAIFLSFVENIAEVRNVCAHDNRLWEFKCKESIKYYPSLHDIYNIKNNSPRSDIYNVYLVLRYFMTPFKYKILTKTLKKRLKNFDNKLESQSINSFLGYLGFPPEWHKQ
ncbi:Abi family protein [Streptococcus parauberis]|uniref:Abi family protein n=1 Tax=Streptococcus parauberis TaxID=1348 RepID=UPI000C1C9959|nr:Abi family protein [Streptococcus parauberis]PIO79870.1 Abi-like protein [Streptococcus parauberis]PNY22046.1 Abi-like protein [Streptococcus parauberis]POS68370.1 Abi-like protein [Streptococcus parauberis]